MFFCVNSLFCLFFVSCFFYSTYLLYLKLFFGKLVAVSILNLSSVINFPPLKDILPVYSLPFLLADMHCNCKVALPLVCRCQVLQTKKICCAIIYDQNSMYFYFPQAAIHHLELPLSITLLLFELFWVKNNALFMICFQCLNRIYLTGLRVFNLTRTLRDDDKNPVLTLARKSLCLTVKIHSALKSWWQYIFFCL